MTRNWYPGLGKPIACNTAGNELTPHFDDHAWPQIHASIMFMCGVCVSFLMTTSCL